MALNSPPRPPTPPPSIILHAYKSPFSIPDDDDDDGRNQIQQPAIPLNLPPSGHAIYIYGPQPTTFNRILQFPSSHLLDLPHLALIGTSLNGVVCVVVHHPPSPHTFTLWNPSTQSVRHLPLPPRIEPVDPHWRLSSFGFGFRFGLDTSTDDVDDYKVVRIACRKPASYKHDVADVFSIKSGRWKRIEQTPKKIEFWVYGHTCDAVIRGVPFWNATVLDYEQRSVREMAVSFDVVNDVFEFHTIGWEMDGREMCMGEFKGCLGAVVWEASDRGVVDVWMKRNRNGRPYWTRKYQVERLPEVGRVLGFYGDRGLVQQVGVEGNLMMFDFVEGKVEDLRNVKNWSPLTSVDLVSYRESSAHIPEIYRPPAKKVSLVCFLCVIIAFVFLMLCLVFIFKK